MAAFSQHYCKQFKYYEHCEIEIQYIDPVSETEVLLLFVTMVKCVTMATST